VGTLVECVVERGDAGIAILWRASSAGAPFAGQGVLLDDAGRGSFTLRVPLSAYPDGITLELVEWGASFFIDVNSLAPSRIDAGLSPSEALAAATVPLAALVLLMVMLLGVAGATSVREAAFAGAPTTRRPSSPQRRISRGLRRDPRSIPARVSAEIGAVTVLRRVTAPTPTPVVVVAPTPVLAPVQQSVPVPVPGVVEEVPLPATATFDDILARLEELRAAVRADALR
jgi:hypothetical protein